MNKKKRIILILLSLVFAVSLYAVPDLAEDVQTKGIKNFNNWDKNFIEGIILFGDSIANWYYLVRQFAIFFCMLNIFYNALKLMLGMEQIKKTLIDIIAKVMLFNVCITVYPLAVDKVVSLATNWGLNATNVASRLANELVVTYQHSYEMSIVAKANVENLLFNSKFEKISDSEIEKIAQATGMTEDKIKQIMHDNNIAGDQEDYDKSKIPTTKIIGKSLLTGAGVGAASGVAFGVACIIAGVSGPVGWAALAVGVLAATGTGNAMKWHNNQLENQKIVATRQVKNELNSIMNSKDIKTSMIIFNAFNDVLGKEGVLTQEEIDIISHVPTSEQKKYSNTIIKKRLNEFVTSLFLSTEGNNTFNAAILSPASMLRVGIMLAQIIQNEGMYTVKTSKEGESKEQKIKQIPQLTSFIWEGDFTNVLGMIYRLLLPWLLMIPLIIIVVEYIVTVLEYYLVTAVGIIFVPLLFMDFTKHYAKNLITLFINYFFKIMFTTIICYYCLSNILFTGRTIVSIADFSLQTVAYATFQFIFSMTIAHAGPRMATALISGQPAMSGGEVTQTMRSMMHGYRAAMGMAKHAGHTVSHGARNAASGLKTAGKAFKTNYDNNNARHDAVDDVLGPKNAGHERAFANALESSGDMNMMNRYAQKTRDKDGNEVFARDKGGHLLLNNEGKKWAENEKNSEYGQNVIKQYNKDRRKLNNKLAAEQWKQRFSGYSYNVATGLNVTSAPGTAKDNLTKKAVDIQNMWEKNPGDKA